MDTNAAYVMATQWLAKAGMDVEGLNRDSERVDVITWELGDKFVPVYVVRWRKFEAWYGDNAAPNL